MPETTRQLVETEASEPARVKYSVPRLAEDGVLRSRKTYGVYYTPRDLAQFMARRALDRLNVSPAVVLDPACGDGELLLAVAREVELAGHPPPELLGVDLDASVVAAASRSLREATNSRVQITHGDFLEPVSDLGRAGMSSVELVISNPPYVRTQVLGATRAQALGRRFKLTGRVDLYQAFVAAMTEVLGDGGLLALLCSNRFISTKGGDALRSLLEHNYDLKELWDLGDTKLFDAAVLPAFLVAEKGRSVEGGTTSFVRVYETPSPSEKSKTSHSLLDYLEGDEAGLVDVARRSFRVERGDLEIPAPGQPWQLSTKAGSAWLRAVRRNSDGRLGDLGKIRVGIKTTADKIFIRRSWDDLPEPLTPEKDLLRPLLTHHVADRWSATVGSDGLRRILYPHEVVGGKRQAIDLEGYPHARRYLESHHERLVGRKYVRDAGRSWYEIWVPQQPDAWAHPKLVWPDISEEPRFFLDRSGALVNGDCYWLSCGDRPRTEVALALAVANSRFAREFYDRCFGNRLYAGRRRFISQYMEELPLPRADVNVQCEIADLVDEACALGQSDPIRRAEIENRLNSTICDLFGIEEVAR